MQIARLRSHVQVQAHLLYLTEQAAPIEIAGAPPSDRHFPVAKKLLRRMAEFHRWAA